MSHWLPILLILELTRAVAEECSLLQVQQAIRQRAGRGEQDGRLPNPAGCSGEDCVLQYLAKVDPTYTWYNTGVEIHGRDEAAGIGWTGTILNMTSGTWDTPAEVVHPLWWHVLVVIIPDNLDPSSDWATLSHEFGINFPQAHLMSLILNRQLGPQEQKLQGPSIAVSSDTLVQRLPELKAAVSKAAHIAVHTQSLVGALFNLPNGYEVFKTDAEHYQRTQDYIKAYAYADFLKHPDNPERIVDLVILRAGVRAMDTIQAWAKVALPRMPIRFGVTGYSKLGAATYMAGAYDPRVKAIAPGAISISSRAMFTGGDTPAVMLQAKSLGAGPEHSFAIEYSPTVRAFALNSTAAHQLQRLIDPPRHRLDLPKLTVMCASDQVVPQIVVGEYDRVMSLPGATRFLYVANCVHDDTLVHPSSMASVAAFFESQRVGAPLPEFRYWFNRSTASFIVTSVGVATPTRVVRWISDPRPSPYFEGAHWASQQVQETGPAGGMWTSTAQPSAGFTAFFLEVEFPGLMPSAPFKFTTPLEVI